MLLIQEAKDRKFVQQRLENLLAAFSEKRIITIVVEPSSKCNLSCTFCDMHSGRYDTDEYKGNMSLETFCTLIDQLKEMPILQEMQFTGNGEPLLNKDLHFFIEYAHRSKVAKKLRLTTNGVMLTPKKLKQVIQSGITSIHISLDVIDAERYKELKGKDNIDIVLRNIDYAVNYIDETKCCELNIKYAIPHQELKYGFNYKDSADLIEKYRSFVDKSEYIHLKGLQVVTINDGKSEMPCPNDTPCEVPFYLMHVRFDGSVSACCSDLFGELEVGNMLNSHLENIIHSKKLQLVRRILLSGNLKALPLCRYCGNRTEVDLTPVAGRLNEMNECGANGTGLAASGRLKCQTSKGDGL